MELDIAELGNWSTTVTSTVRLDGSLRIELSVVSRTSVMRRLVSLCEIEL